MLLVVGAPAALWCVFWLAAMALVVNVPLDHADAIVVMAGSRAYRERAEWAASLFRRGVAPRIVITDEGTRGGWNNREERNPRLVEVALHELARGGVPPNAIVELPPPSRGGTYGEIEAIERYRRRSGLRSLLVVTSAHHTRRVRWTLERVLGPGARFGVEGVPLVRAAQGTTWWWLFRSGWKSVGGEYAKLGYYWFVHGGQP